MLLQISTCCFVQFLKHDEQEPNDSNQYGKDLYNHAPIALYNIVVCRQVCVTFNYISVRSFHIILDVEKRDD